MTVIHRPSNMARTVNSRIWMCSGTNGVNGFDVVLISAARCCYCTQKKIGYRAVARRIVEKDMSRACGRVFFRQDTRPGGSLARRSASRSGMKSLKVDLVFAELGQSRVRLLFF